MEKIKLVVVGCAGRMGQQIIKQISSRPINMEHIIKTFENHPELIKINSKYFKNIDYLK